MGVDVDGVRAAAPQVAEVPYDAARRRVTTAHDDPAGVLVVCKGAPEAVWPLLVTSTDGKSSGAAAGRPVADRWTAEGLRVVAVATTRRTVAGNTAGRLEAGLRLVGLVALDGRVRDGSAEAVAAAGAAGIDVVLVTPDHESTALARARRVGITTARRGVGMVTGDALRTGRWADDLRVLARMAPDQHRDAVARWRSAGHVVALTGAGTAEIPAVRLADVGIALGPGDEALAAAADIRTDRPDLAAVNAAVVAGRRARAVTRLLLGLAAAALLAVGAAVLVGAAVGTPWLWPEQAALAAVVVTMVPAALLARENSLSGLPPGGQHPASRLVDTWWSLWTLGWGVGTGLFALLVGGAVLLAGASPGLVAGPIVAGALAGAAVTGARAVRGPHPARAAGWILVAAVVVLAAAVAGVAWARDGGATGTGVLVAPAVLLGSAVAGAIAARGRPHA
jgi:Ca2+-transporting ATPase